MFNAIRSWFKKDRPVYPLAPTIPPIFFAAGSLHAVPFDDALPLTSPRINAAGDSWEMAPLSLPHIDIIAKGAPANGLDSDSAALQAAVDELVPTGGTIFLQPNRVYSIDTKISIKSRYPIWIVSKMFSRNLAGAAGNTHTTSAMIRPMADMDYMFEWDLPDADDHYAESGGGGLEGLVFADVNGATFRQWILGGAVSINEAVYFTIRDCLFTWLQGRAIRVGVSTITRIKNSYIGVCGSPGKPALDIRGTQTDGVTGATGDGTPFAGVNLDWVFFENSKSEPYIKLDAPTGITIDNCYFEDGVSDIWGTNGNGYIDASTGGGINVDHTQFNGTLGPSVKIGGLVSIGNVIQNSHFNNFPGANHCIDILSTAPMTKLHNLRFSLGAQTGRAVNVQANHCQLSDLTFTSGGGIDASGVNHCTLNNIFMYGCSQVAGQYAIDLGVNKLSGGLIDGLTPSASQMVCHGVRTTTGQITDFQVSDLSGGNGITSTGAASFSGCRAENMNGGLPFVINTGTLVNGCTGNDTTDIDDNSDDSVVVNWNHGTITTKALDTLAGATYSILINNTMVAATSRVIATARLDSATTGVPIVLNCVPVSSGFTLTIYNAGVAAFNGTLLIDFAVFN